MAAKIARIYCLALAIFALTACGTDPLDDKINRQQQLTKQQVQLLEKQLDRGQVRNANLIPQYADIVAVSNPKLTPLLDQLKLDATTDGMLFQGLQRRYQDAVTYPDTFTNKQAQLDELANIYQAADPLVFNDLLSDSLNVIADMSQGTLPRINGDNLQASLTQNNAKDYGSGSELVGNPNYGSWQSNSNGTSFWAWYGMYSMFNNIMSPRIDYRDWSHNRNYSYYSDQGRNKYRSAQQRTADTKFEQKTKKSFNRSGNYQSPYAKQRTSSAIRSSRNRYQTTGSSQQSQNSAKKFRSNSSQNKFASRSSHSKSSYSKSRSKKSSSGFRTKRRRR